MLEETDAASFISFLVRKELGSDLGLDNVRCFPTGSPCCSGQISRRSLDTRSYLEVLLKRRVRTLHFNGNQNAVGRRRGSDILEWTDPE